jgi:hypothetical protein
LRRGTSVDDLRRLARDGAATVDASSARRRSRRLGAADAGSSSVKSEEEPATGDWTVEVTTT